MSTLIFDSNSCSILRTLMFVHKVIVNDKTIFLMPFHRISGSQYKVLLVIVYWLTVLINNVWWQIDATMHALCLSGYDYYLANRMWWQLNVRMHVLCLVILAMANHERSPGKCNISIWLELNWFIRIEWCTNIDSDFGTLNKWFDLII